MKACSLTVITIFVCYIYRYASVEIKPVLKKYVSKFGHAINYKYEGMFAHSLDRFYVVTKFILPTIRDLKFSAHSFDDKCKYLEDKKKGA